jgi:hypothetical protein
MCQEFTAPNIPKKGSYGPELCKVWPLTRFIRSQEFELSKDCCLVSERSYELLMSNLRKINRVASAGLSSLSAAAFLLSSSYHRTGNNGHQRVGGVDRSLMNRRGNNEDGVFAVVNQA